MNVYWRPHHEVYPELAPDQDFAAFDGERIIGRVRLVPHSGREGQWHWAMTAHSTARRVPFEIHGHEDSRGDAGRRVVAAYGKLLAHNNNTHARASQGSSQMART